MAEGEPYVVLEGYSYLECPRWHEGRLWVSDFYTHRVLATDGGVFPAATFERFYEKVDPNRVEPEA
jgi:hypothetical protein